MKRKDWITRVQEVFRRAENNEFTWGSFDCAFFAKECAYAIGYTDSLNWDIPEYKSIKEAKKILYDHGTYKDYVIAISGKQPIPKNKVVAGDIVLIRTDSVVLGEALGVCMGQKSVFLSGKRGTPLITLDTDNIECGWRI